MVIGASMQSHKAKFKKETSDDTLKNLQKTETSECHRSTTLHFNVINKYILKVSKKGDLYYEKYTDSIKNPYKKK